MKPVNLMIAIDLGTRTDIRVLGFKWDWVRTHAIAELALYDYVVHSNTHRPAEMICEHAQDVLQVIADSVAAERMRPNAA